MIDRKKLLINIVFLMLFNFALDRMAHGFYWYFSIWWFDMIMHFLGGFWVGLFFIYVLTKKDSALGSIVKVALSLLFISILWELFEVYANNFIGQTPFDIWDTLSDLCFDIAGGASAYIYFLKNIMNKEEDTVSL